MVVAKKARKEATRNSYLQQGQSVLRGDTNKGQSWPRPKRYSTSGPAICCLRHRRWLPCLRQVIAGDFNAWDLEWGNIENNAKSRCERKMTSSELLNCQISPGRNGALYSAQRAFKDLQMPINAKLKLHSPVSEIFIRVHFSKYSQGVTYFPSTSESLYRVLFNIRNSEFKLSPEL